MSTPDVEGLLDLACDHIAKAMDALRLAEKAGLPANHLVDRLSRISGDIGRIDYSADDLTRDTLADLEEKPPRKRKGGGE